MAFLSLYVITKSIVFHQNSQMFLDMFSEFFYIEDT